MEKIYTLQNWEHDRDFRAEAGQEITEEVYNRMLECMPPLSLPREKAEQALHDYSIPVHGGFLMGEPHSTSPKSGKPLYLAFGMHDYGKGKHFFYLGLSVREKELDGTFYYFDCMNADVNRFFKASDFVNDDEAITFGANYEATVYKCTMQHGALVKREMLYDPWACMDN